MLQSTKKSISLLLLCCLAFTFIFVGTTVTAVTEIADGILPGDGVIPGAQWRLYDDGTLIVEEGSICWNGGTIGMWAFSPWDVYQQIYDVEIYKIVFTGTVIGGTSLRGLFAMLGGLTEIEGLSYLDIENVTDMSFMFFGATNLTSLDLSTWNTQNVTNMISMLAMTGLRQITLGENFEFKHLPDDGDYHIDGGGYLSAGLSPIPQNEDFTGYWQNVGDGTFDSPQGEFLFTSAELMANFDGSIHADTWVRQPTPIYELEITADLDFGRVAQGSGTLERTIIIENVGNQRITVEVEKGPFVDFSPPSLTPFTLQNSTSPQEFTKVLNPGEQFILELILDRSFDTGIHFKWFTVLSCFGLDLRDEETLTARVELYNPLEVTPISLDFGTIQYSATLPAAQTITITNIGSVDLTLNALPNVPGFTLGNLENLILEPEQNVTIEVSINVDLPVGNHETTFTISTAEGANVDIELHFTVVEPIPPLLYSINYTGGTLRPAFDPNVFEYTFTASRNWWLEPYYNENLIVEWSGRGVRITYADGHEGNPDFREIEIIGSPVVFTVRNPVTDEEQVYTVIIRKTGGVVADSSPILSPGSTVTFNTNGGDAIDNQRVNHNGRVTRPTDPTRDGFVFEGWYADSAFVTQFDFNTQITGNITIFARWTERIPPHFPDDWQNPFVDVNNNDWFYNYVRYVFTNNLMQGVSPTEFVPNAPTTRAMFVTVLHRLAGSSTANGESQFVDVASGTWYNEAVAWAAANGIVLGVSETEFAPHLEITREQMAAMVYRGLHIFAPNSFATQMHFIFEDADEISPFANNAIQTLANMGIMQGNSDGTFNPQGLATRAEVAAVLQRISN